MDSLHAEECAALPVTTKTSVIPVLTQVCKCLEREGLELLKLSGSTTGQSIQQYGTGEAEGVCILRGYHVGKHLDHF